MFWTQMQNNYSRGTEAKALIVNALGPLCLWQCLYFHLAIFVFPFGNVCISNRNFLLMLLTGCISLEIGEFVFLLRLVRSGRGR